MRQKTIILTLFIILTCVFIQGCANSTSESKPNPAEPAVTIRNTQSGTVEPTFTIQLNSTETTPQIVEIDASALIQERCTVCHSTTRIENKKASLDGWKLNVERMITNGAVLNADEKDVLIEYLAATYPE